MEIRNKIGLEAEFLLRDKNGKLVYPAEYGFSTDEFVILGEFRADAGWYRHQTVGNFVTAMIQVLNRAQEKGLSVDFSGVAEITPQEKAEIIRKVGAKYVPPCNNVYKTDILNFSDDVVNEKGQITASRLSCGLHVHFSRRVYHKYVGENKIPVEYDINILTPSQIKRIVREMDNEILSNYSLNFPLKYRQPGFYELKPWGFEYRSLPMIEKFTSLGDLRVLVDFAFSLLERLEK